MQVKGLFITGGKSKYLNVFEMNSQNLIQNIRLQEMIYSGLFVKPDTLYIGCLGGYLYIFKVEDSQLGRR